MTVGQLKDVLSTYCKDLRNAADSHGMDNDFATMDDMMVSVNKCRQLLRHMDDFDTNDTLNIVNCGATFTPAERAILIHALYHTAAYLSKRIAEDNKALMEALTVSSFLGRIGNE